MSKDSADDASVVSQQLYRLVNQHFGLNDEADPRYPMQRSKPWMMPRKLG